MLLNGTDSPFVPNVGLHFALFPRQWGDKKVIGLMSGMSKFLSSFHYAVKHCLTILWQILEYIQKSHFIFSKMVIKHLPKCEQEVPALVYPPCQICNSDTTNGSLVCFPALSVSIRFARRLAKGLQILYSVSDSLWIWAAFVPKTAAIPMSSKCSDHTTEPDFNSSFFQVLYHSCWAKVSEKQLSIGETLSDLFFFNLGVASVYTLPNG